ncbi:prepilin peptidase [Candidatus Beckwithbacteria bacterium]|nr:prepilin peptidase [Candidatus Beckwithbacteria bacterium]
MLVYLLLFIFGLIIGSFLNVVVYRETHESKGKKTGLKAWIPEWAIGRSCCPKCKKEIKWYDNIPLLSYLLLKGKCRFCKQHISSSYPLVELVVGLEFVWVYWLLGRFAFFQQMEGFFSFVVLGFWLFIFSISLALAIIDIRLGILPDSLIISGTIVAVGRLFITGRWEFLLSGLGLMGFFLFLYLITQGKGIGFGDVKLAFFIGVVLGWWQWVLVAMFIAFLTGAIMGVILIAMGKKNMKSAIPFGPFLLGGMLLAKLFGEYIWLSYVGI